MQQLALELLQYPRPIAWTISEVNRAEGHRDHRDMLLAAYEEVIRYLVLVETARYTEYWASGRGDAEVDRALGGLRKPSLGHYVAALRELDEFLSEASDRYAIGAQTKHTASMMCKLCEEGPGAPKRVKQVSLLQVFSRVTELRNEEKGHGYTGQLHAEATTALLQPALQELLERIPLLLAQPLVWVEHIELVDEGNLIVTLLVLMGTQRAQRIRRDVREAGSLKKGFLYMWDGEASPLRLTPFLHLERSQHDEQVYVLAGVAGEPVYRSRGTTGGRHPDHLMSQLEERAPFLLKPVESTTVATVPNAPRFYQSAVEVALADGGVSEAEVSQLDRVRKDLGLTAYEAQAVHARLGWDGSIGARAAVAPPPVAQPMTPSEWEPERGRSLLAAVGDAVGAALDPAAVPIALADAVDIGEGELWLKLGPTQGTAVWFVGRRLDRVKIAVGFYSRNDVRDPVYRAVRRRLEGFDLQLLPGWKPMKRNSKSSAGLALETTKRVAVVELTSQRTVQDVAGVLLVLTRQAQRALASTERDDTPPEPVDAHAPVSMSVPDDFPLEPLTGSPRLQGSVWLARLLWALEHARRSNTAPINSAEIARLLTEHGTRVPGTNTARAFRTPQDDPRRTGLCEEHDQQRYSITTKGRRSLYEWLSRTSENTD